MPPKRLPSDEPLVSEPMRLWPILIVGLTLSRKMVSDVRE